MNELDVESLRDTFELLDDGLYHKRTIRSVKSGSKAGTLKRGVSVIQYQSLDYYTKNLVYFYHHGYFSDYDLFNYDGDPSNNGILNLLEEGETLVRLNNGLRYDPATKIYYKRQYLGHSLHHQYVEVPQ